MDHNEIEATRNRLILIVEAKEVHTGYSFWDQLQNFLHKFTWIVLSVHKLNKLGKFMDNSCQVMADMKKVYDNLTIINL